LNGWKASKSGYLKDIIKNNRLIQKYLGTQPIYFRPPYGKINYRAIHEVERFPLRIVMWSQIYGDWLPKFSSPIALQYFKSHFQNRDILLLHDSPKAIGNIKIFLPMLLRYIKDNRIDITSL
jgi:peptidoglycan/xylan/chitin deacetylase (PgdA/CDA1 family)